MQAFSSLLRNTFFGVIASLLYRIANTLLFIYVVQSIGVNAAGVFALAVSYFFLSSRFALWGLDHILTREVAKDRDKASLYLSNFLFLRFVSAIISIVLLFAVIQLAPYSSETRLVIGIMLLSVLPENINNLCWAGYAAFEEYQFTSIGTLLGGMVKVGLGFLMIWLGYGLVTVALVYVIGNLFTMIVNLIIVKRRYIYRWHRVDITFIRHQVPIAVPFIVIGFFFILDNRLDNVILSILNDEREVGLYAAATAVFVALGVIAEGYRIAILPIMVRYHRDRPESMGWLYHQSIKYLIIVAIPLAATTILLAEDVIRIVYRQYLPSAVPALQIVSLALVFFFVNMANNRLLVTYNQQGTIARIVVVAAVLNIIVNLILARSLGAVGAASARFLSIATIFILTTLSVRSIIPGLNYFKYAWRPLIAAGLMSLVIWQMESLSLWIQILTGSLVYGLSLLALGAVTPSERDSIHAFVRQNREAS